MRLYDQTGIQSMAVARDIAALIVTEREAWERLLKAEVAAAEENAPCPSAATLAERDAARSVARALGLIAA